MEWHKVHHANYSDFRTGFVHPDRNMDLHDLVYLIEGEWEIFLEGTPYLLLPDHLLILPAGNRHYGKIPCKEGTKTLYLHLTAALGDQSCIGRGTESEGIFLPELIDCRKDTSVRRLFQEIVSIYWGLAPHRETELSAKVKLLLCALYRMENPFFQSGQRTAVLIELIQRHPERFFTLQELAQAVHLHSRTISDEFKRVTGQTPHQYQINLKLQMAYSEIQTYSNRSLREIGEAYGFYDEFHFSKSFKNKFGFPPSRLRHPF